MTFEEIYATRPDKKNHGSSGYSRMKHLYDICMELKPKLIIESGTWKGNSSYLFRKSLPNAVIWCFDITFENQLWYSDDIEYIEQDIWGSVHDVSKLIEYHGSENTLCFFDDHVSHLDRLKFAVSVGLKHLIFDDNVSEEEAKTLKAPPIPTLKMIHTPHYMAKTSVQEVITHIDKMKVLPYLGNDTRDTYLTYVELV